MRGNHSRPERDDNDQNADPAISMPRPSVGTSAAAAVCHHEAV
jgi:hypothetical protein